MRLREDHTEAREGTTRREFLYAGLVLGATAGGLSVLNQAQNHDHHGKEGNDHYHPTPEQLRVAKMRIRDANRRRIAEVIDPAGLRLDALSAAEVALLTRELPIEDACMDEGIVLRGAHKFGIAGNTAGTRGTEFAEFIARSRGDRNYMRRLRRSWAHEGCAAQGKDDIAALAAAQQTARELGLPEDRVSMAGFSSGVDLRMQRPAHIHPAQGLLLDATGTVNEQALRLPILKISTRNVPSTYVDRQIAVVNRVLEGDEGMAEVLEEQDPTFAIFSGRNAREIDDMIRLHSGVLDRFTKRPVMVPHIVS
jgi:hypothetical protein